jgi:hypothetical protein
MKRLTSLAAVLALAALLFSGAAGATTTVRHRRHAKQHVAARKLTPAPAQAGLVVAWDPESRTFTMPAPDRLALTAAERNAISRSFTGLVEVHHPDGSVSVDLQGRFREFAVVHTGPDGKPVFHCLDDSASVRRALLEPQPASGLEDR